MPAETWHTECPSFDRAPAAPISAERLTLHGSLGMNWSRGEASTSILLSFPDTLQVSRFRDVRDGALMERAGNLAAVATSLSVSLR